MKKYKTLFDYGIQSSLIFISITFPLPFNISNLGVVALLLFWVSDKIVNRSAFAYKQLPLNKRAILLAFVALFVIQITALLFTTNIEHGIKNVESKLSLLVIPIILFDLTISRSKLIQLLKYFVYSMALCSVYLLLNSVYHYWSEGELLTYHDFVGPLDFHAIFYSYYIFLATLFCIYLFLQSNPSRTEKALYMLSLALYTCGLIISASKNVLAVTVLFLLFGFIYRSLRTRIKIKEVILALTIGVISVVVIAKIPTINERLKEIVDLRGMSNYHKVKRGEILNNDDVQEFNGTSLRILLWDLGINRLMEENRLFVGLSPGDRRDIMNNELDQIGLLYYYENYNLHNQFIQTFVELGLLGLLIYILLHVLIISQAIQQKNMLLLAFVIGLVFFQMTESVIERNKGIVYYCFFLSILLMLNSKNENRDIRN